MKGSIWKMEEVLGEDFCKRWVIVIDFDKEPPFKLGECEVTQK